MHYQSLQWRHERRDISNVTICNRTPLGWRALWNQRRRNVTPSDSTVNGTSDVTRLSGIRHITSFGQSRCHSGLLDEGPGWPSTQILTFAPLSKSTLCRILCRARPATSPSQVSAGSLRPCASLYDKGLWPKTTKVVERRRRFGFTSAHLCAATSPDCTKHYWDIHIYESMFAGVRRWLTRTPASLSCLLVLKTVRPWLSEGGKHWHDRKEFYPSSGSSNRYQRDSKCDKNEFGIIRSENWP